MEFPNGIWPVMLTPFTEDNKVDYPALEKLVDWYFAQGCDGLFAVCQSSEMFFLSLEERLEIARFVKQAAKGRPVIASGHISESIEEQKKELQGMAQTGIDALILISSCVAKPDEDDDVFLANLKELMDAIPGDMPLGLYECPFPYKRVLSKKITKFCAESGRFYFLKDTSCRMDSMLEKLEVMQGTNMKLYNANTATLLDSFKAGAAGYCGVMANFHPQLYRALYDGFEKNPEQAEGLQEILTMCSLIENSTYPVNAKYALQQSGLPMTTVTRKTDRKNLTYAQMCEAMQVMSLTKRIEQQLENWSK